MWDKVGPKNWRRPLLLRPDNFTPPPRTPWGGRRIGDHLKAGLGLERRGQIGEAWELSVEPDFPSRLVEGPSLDEVLRHDPALLGLEAALGSTALLVKLVDAADPLSVQIHPCDDDPHLAADESSKPEAWYVIDADRGAGLYIGLRQGVSRQDVEETIEAEGEVDELMPFVPVSAGDAFLIDPGMPHAVGKGVFLLEPQRVWPGRRGVTYRYWDWNRKYDASGRLNPDGNPRTLHLERALESTRWEGPRGADLLERIRHCAGPIATDGEAKLETLVCASGPLRSASFFLQRAAGCGAIELAPRPRLRSLTVLDGQLSIHDGPSGLTLRRGQTAALPACLGPLHIELNAAHAMICSLA